MTRLTWTVAVTALCVLPVGCGNEKDAGGGDAAETGAGATSQPAGGAKKMVPGKKDSAEKDSAEKVGAEKASAENAPANHGPIPADYGTNAKNYGEATVDLTKEYLAARWPENESTVFQSTYLVVGLPNSKVDGQIAVMPNGKPVPKGQQVSAGEGVQLLEKGYAFGPVELPIGEVQCVVQVLDKDGRSLGPDWSHSATYHVKRDPERLAVWFEEPKANSVVGRKFKVKFGVAGMAMSPAEERPGVKLQGHHHVLINLRGMPPGRIIPKDERRIHFGDGSTEGEIELEPGQYRITAQFADGNHRSYGRYMSHSIAITVK